MRRSPDHAVLGATELEVAIGFLCELGFEHRHTGLVPAPAARSLYELEAETRQALLAVPGASRGWVRVVETPNPPFDAGHFDRRGHGIDLYTTDIDGSVALASGAGARCGPIACYRVGALEIKEVKADGPDGLTVVFIQASTRRPSILDRNPDRLHSELHSIVWIVDSLDAATAFWRDRLGLEPLLETTLREPAVAALIGLPRPDVALRLSLLAGADVDPARLELIEFPEDDGRDLPRLPLRAGLHAIGFVVDDLESTMADWAEARLGDPVAFEWPPLGELRAVAGVSPGGASFELWQGLLPGESGPPEPSEREIRLRRGRSLG